jgi:hypothetical protein
MKNHWMLVLLLVAIGAAGAVVSGWYGDSFAATAGKPGMAGKAGLPDIVVVRQRVLIGDSYLNELHLLQKSCMQGLLHRDVSDAELPPLESLRDTQAATFEEYFSGERYVKIARVVRAELPESTCQYTRTVQTTKEIVDGCRYVRVDVGQRLVLAEGDQCEGVPAEWIALHRAGFERKTAALADKPRKQVAGVICANVGVGPEALMTNGNICFYAEMPYYMSMAPRPVVLESEVGWGPADTILPGKTLWGTDAQPPRWRETAVKFEINRPFDRGVFDLPADFSSYTKTARTSGAKGG